MINLKESVGIFFGHEKTDNYIHHLVIPILSKDMENSQFLLKLLTRILLFMSFAHNLEKLALVILNDVFLYPGFESKNSRDGLQAFHQPFPANSSIHYYLFYFASHQETE